MGVEGGGAQGALHRGACGCGVWENVVAAGDAGGARKGACHTDNAKGAASTSNAGYLKSSGVAARERERSWQGHQSPNAWARNNKRPAHHGRLWVGPTLVPLTCPYHPAREVGGGLGQNGWENDFVVPRSPPVSPLPQTQNRWWGWYGLGVYAFSALGDTPLVPLQKTCF